MKVWPLVSMSVDWVCWAVFVAICLVWSVVTAVLRILILTVLFLFSCFWISLIVCGVGPFFPIRTVGFFRKACV